MQSAGTDKPAHTTWTGAKATLLLGLGIVLSVVLVPGAAPWLRVITVLGFASAGVILLTVEHSAASAITRAIRSRRTAALEIELTADNLDHEPPAQERASATPRRGMLDLAELAGATAETRPFTGQELRASVAARVADNQAAATEADRERSALEELRRLGLYDPFGVSSAPEDAESTRSTAAPSARSVVNPWALPHHTGAPDDPYPPLRLAPDDDEIPDEELTLEERVERLPEPVRREAKAYLTTVGNERLGEMAARICVDIKWVRPEPKPIDLVAARDLLDRSHACLNQVKEEVLDYLALLEWHRSQGLSGGLDWGVNLCLLGEPGTGKTSIAKTIAAATGRKLIHISLSGADDIFLGGCDRSYRGAGPGEIVRRLQQNNAHPSEVVFLFDEIDKVIDYQNRSAVPTLLTALDPSQNKDWRDKFLSEIGIDLSQALVVATANREDTISPPLLNRLHVINVPKYSHAEQAMIARDYIIPRLFEKLAITDQIEITDDAVEAAVTAYGEGGGMRQIEQQLSVLVGRAVRNFMLARQPIIVNAELLKLWLRSPEKKGGPIGFRGVGLG